MNLKLDPGIDDWEKIAIASSHMVDDHLQCNFPGLRDSDP
jgi:hypothetical protein